MLARTIYTPVLGHALSYARNPLGFVERIVAEYGPVASFTIAGQNGISLADPNAIEHVLARNAANYRKGGFQRKEFQGLPGVDLLISEAQQWESARKAIQPAFYPGQITEYASAMVDCTEQRIADWKNGNTVDIAEAPSDITLTIPGEALFNTDFQEATTVHTVAEFDHGYVL